MQIITHEHELMEGSSFTPTEILKYVNAIKYTIKYTIISANKSQKTTAKICLHNLIVDNFRFHVKHCCWHGTRYHITG